jgi:8-oxo-dGTP pyrophosphatase MutT (NUDIX family)
MQSIVPALARYRERHPHEHDVLARVSDFVAQTTQSTDLISRHNAAGHVTASGFVISAARDAVLLVHHRGLGLYLQPGGHLDATDASPVNGARREVAEETGLYTLQLIESSIDTGDGVTTPFDIDSHYIPPNPRKGEPEHWHHDFRYLFAAPEQATLALSDREVADARWVPLGELATYPTLERVAIKIPLILQQTLNDAIPRR